MTGDAAPVDLAVVSNDSLAKLLKRHPRVKEVQVTPEAEGLEFIRDGRSRFVFQGKADEELKGLVELMDNNPLVCADRFSVPDPASTLALIALGPAALAGLIDPREGPLEGEVCNAAIDQDCLRAFLGTVGLAAPLDLRIGKGDQVFAYPSAIFVMSLDSNSVADIRQLYEERYGASFFVNVCELDAGWTQDPLKGSDYQATLCVLPHVAGHSARVAAMVASSTNGKCGAAQLVHAMNIMAGFEESLGVAP